MSKRVLLSVVIASALLGPGVSHAQYPILDRIADKVIHKYQSESCEDLWKKRGQKPSEEVERLMGFLRTDTQMRQAFFNKIAGPVMNKMFECGMIP